MLPGRCVCGPSELFWVFDYLSMFALTAWKTNSSAFSGNLWVGTLSATKHHSLFCLEGVKDRRQSRNVAIKTTPDFRRQPETVTFRQALDVEGRSKSESWENRRQATETSDQSNPIFTDRCQWSNTMFRPKSL